jgi:hypothetical protein
MLDENLIFVLQTVLDSAGFEHVAIDGRTEPGKRIRYCRQCELACSLAKP